jgi:pimeloyl-ACP methyl ester carboxylesterase
MRQCKVALIFHAARILRLQPATARASAQNATVNFIMTQPQDSFITANNLTFHLIDWGGDGEWLIFLHGLASQAHMFDLVAPKLIDSFRIVAIDQRGHGLSDKPDSGYDCATVTSDLDAILRALKIDRAVLAGHSWGGNVAVQYAADHPDRVSSLILIDGGFLQIGDRLDWPTVEKFLEPPDLIGMPVDEFRSGMKMWMGSAWSPEAEAITLQNFEIRADGTIAPRMRKSNHMQVVRALWEHRPSELWARLQCSVLMIPAVAPEPHDERTRSSLDNKRRNIATAEQRLQRSQTIWMTDTIHDIPLQRPAELAEAIKRFATTR